VRTFIEMGERLRAFRERRRMTQEQLSAATGASQRVISNWEMGQRQPAVSSALAVKTALRMTWREFVEVFGVELDGKGQKPKPVNQTRSWKIPLVGR